jgi:hypothetical protein
MHGIDDIEGIGARSVGVNAGRRLKGGIMVIDEGEVTTGLVCRVILGMYVGYNIVSPIEKEIRSLP